MSNINIKGILDKSFDEEHWKNPIQLLDAGSD